MNRDEINNETLRYFLDYLRIDTSNPPGNEIEGALFLKRILDNEGIESRIYETLPRRGNLIAKIEGNKHNEPLFLLNHIDVVPVDREKWNVNPFGGEIKDGYIFGRGTQDMKAMGIIQLMVMILLKRENLKLKRDVYFIAAADEERESNYGVIKLIENIPDMRRKAYIITEGGGGTRGIFSEDNKIIWAVGVGEKKPLFLHLDIIGKAGHGSLPDKDNPNEILIEVLNRILEYGQDEIKFPVVEETKRRLGKIIENKFTNAIIKNTITLTTLRAGVGDPPRENVIPSKSKATLDCRLMPEVNTDVFIKRLEQLIDDDRVKIKPTKLPGQVPVSPYDTELFRIIETSANKKVSGSVTVPVLVPYATDSRYFRQHGSICYGFTPIIADLDELSLMHSDNEKVSEKEFLKGTELLYDIVKGFCG